MPAGSSPHSPNVKSNVCAPGLTVTAADGVPPSTPSVAVYALIDVAADAGDTTVDTTRRQGPPRPSTNGLPMVCS